MHTIEHELRSPILRCIFNLLCSILRTLIVIRHQRTLSVSRRFIYFSLCSDEFACPLILTCQLYSCMYVRDNSIFSSLRAHTRSLANTISRSALSCGSDGGMCDVLVDVPLNNLTLVSLRHCSIEIVRSTAHIFGNSALTAPEK